MGNQERWVCPFDMIVIKLLFILSQFDHRIVELKHINLMGLKNEFAHLVYDASLAFYLV